MKWFISTSILALRKLWSNQPYAYDGTINKTANDIRHPHYYTTSDLNHGTKQHACSASYNKRYGRQNAHQCVQ